MNKVLKIMLRRFVLILLFTTPILNAGDTGGALVGGLFGGMMGSAMTRPRGHSTVVVKETGGVTRAELIQLEQAVRSDLNRIYKMVQDNEDTMRDKIRDLEDEIARLKRAPSGYEEARVVGSELAKKRQISGREFNDGVKPGEEMVADEVSEVIRAR